MQHWSLWKGTNCSMLDLSDLEHTHWQPQLQNLSRLALGLIEHDMTHAQPMHQHT